MSFGFALKKFREGRDLTLRELAKLSGVDHVYIYRLEKKERNSPSKKTVDSFIHTLKLDKRRARLLRFLVGKRVNDQLIEVFLENEKLSIELFESLASMSFRGKRPRSREEWRNWAKRLEKFMDE